MAIHPTAIIEPGAQVAEGVTIGAYAYIGSQATLGTGTVVHHHATVEGLTTLGEGNEVFPYALIGGKTHDLKYTSGTPGLIIGNNNTFREYVTIHVATKAGEFTQIGSHNVILAYSHVAHDCVIGDHLVMSSHAALGGHVQVGNHVNVGWGSGVHQFCRLGDFAMAGASSKVVQDIPPYMIADGSPATVRTLNRVGLERNEFSPAQLEALRALYKILYRSGNNRSQALEIIQSEFCQGDPKIVALANTLVQFIRSSKRSIC